MPLGLGFFSTSKQCSLLYGLPSCRKFDDSLQLQAPKFKFSRKEPQKCQPKYHCISLTLTASCSCLWTNGEDQGRGWSCYPGLRPTHIHLWSKGWRHHPKCMDYEWGRGCFPEGNLGAVTQRSGNGLPSQPRPLSIILISHLETRWPKLRDRKLFVQSHT